MAKEIIWELHIPQQKVLSILDESISKELPISLTLFLAGGPTSLGKKSFFGDIKDSNFRIQQLRDDHGRRIVKYWLTDPYLYGRVVAIPYGSKIFAHLRIHPFHEASSSIFIFGTILFFIFSAVLMSFFHGPQVLINFAIGFIALIVLLSILLAPIIFVLVLRVRSGYSQGKKIIEFMNELFSKYKINEIENNKGQPDAINNKNI